MIRSKPKYYKRVELWQGGDPEFGICLNRPLVPPSILSFDNNPEETIGFFQKIRRGFDTSMESRKSFIKRCDKIGPVITGYSDFSLIENISTAASVVLAADYQRLMMLFGEVPPTVELSKWSDPVFNKLYQLGFFEILGHTPDVSDRLTEDGNTLTMRIVSAENAHPTHFGIIDSSIQELVKFLLGAGEIQISNELDSQIVDLLTSISEALTNVTQHAYPKEFKKTHECIERYWVSASADRGNRLLTIVVYDQGATVPGTYPRLSLGRNPVRFLRRALRRDIDEFDYANDHTYIRAAMRYGRSQTDEPFRGKGFPQMLEQLQKIGNGRMRVYSRAGCCIAPTKKKMKSLSFNNSLGGTLVEWKVEIPNEL